MMGVGEKGKQEGMQLSLLAQAARAGSEWATAAMAHLQRIAASGQSFSSEDVRIEAEAAGLAPPLEPRAWGAIFYHAARAGLIVKDGHGVSQNPQAHDRPITIWRRP